MGQEGGKGKRLYQLSLRGALSPNSTFVTGHIFLYKKTHQRHEPNLFFFDVVFNIINIIINIINIVPWKKKKEKKEKKKEKKKEEKEKD